MYDLYNSFAASTILGVAPAGSVRSACTLEMWTLCVVESSDEILFVRSLDEFDV